MMEFPSSVLAFPGERCVKQGTTWGRPGHKDAQIEAADSVQGRASVLQGEFAPCIFSVALKMLGTHLPSFVLSSPSSCLILAILAMSVLKALDS